MFTVVDTTTGRLLGQRIGLADGFVSRLVGLLGRPSLGEGEGLWITPCDSIHTFFMRFPIDVVFVNKDGVVLRRLDAIPAWRATRIHSKATACLELPAGVLEAAGVMPGHRLEMRPSAAGADSGTPSV